MEQLPYTPTTGNGMPFHKFVQLSADERALQLPKHISIMQQPEYVRLSTSPRMKTISAAMNMPIKMKGLEPIGPLGAALTFPDGRQIAIITTCLDMHPDDARCLMGMMTPGLDFKITEMFPLDHNEKERTAVTYRKYHAGFIQNCALPMLTKKRQLTADTKKKELLPLHFTFDAMCLKDVIMDTLGDFGPALGSQFILCPPEEEAIISFLKQVGLMFVTAAASP